MRLARRTVEEVQARRGDPVPPDALAAVAPIVEEVGASGEAAVRAHAARLGELPPDGDLYIDPAAMRAALEALPAGDRARLERVAGRIRYFAEAQRAAMHDVRLAVPGGAAGHRLTPVERAGCYVPGGRYPLPSSLLMTAVPARVAGVTTVWAASPKPGPLTLAAGAVAGLDGLLAVGGAQAIAALAYGCGPIPPCDLVVGPGNRYVTAAKYLVSRHVAIDMLAGPSELVVVADETANPVLIAVDLLAQAEHDVVALPLLVSTSAELIARVEEALEEQLAHLPTRDTAREALEHGGALLVTSVEEACAASDRLAPEHVHLCVRHPDQAASRLRHYGAVFLGQGSAEVLGDYGAGPNHTLPTGGTARGRSGLSVATFLRAQTWLEVNPGRAAELPEDAAWFGRIEGLEAHARSAEHPQRLHAVTGRDGDRREHN